jgi:hypothetical protein
MFCIPLAILALAAGVYLLIQTRLSGLGGIYRGLSWLVITLSLLFMLGGAVRGVAHWRHMRQEMASGHCDMHRGGHGFHDMGGLGACPMGMPGCMGMGSPGMQGSCCTMGGAAMPACCSGMGMGADSAKAACCTKDSSKTSASAHTGK